MRCANTRATTSFGPPAANGLIMVRGRVGHSSAPAPVVKASEARTASAATFFHMVSSRIFTAVEFRRTRSPQPFQGFVEFRSGHARGPPRLRVHQDRAGHQG